MRPATDDPKIFVFIDLQLADKIVGDRAWVVFAVIECNEAHAIKTLEAAIGGNPNIAVIVLYNVEYFV